ncbi:MAG TPA: AMP-binding protein [Vicinamibacterales bacterium]|nr:AMP-binding protein [Vicinamibacterales bacterium]
MTVTDLFARSFRERAGEPALEFTGRAFTFGELDARADRVAALLLSRGFSAGDRLAVYLDNRVEFIDLFLACTRLGVILVPINILYRERELAHIVSDAEPRAIVSSGPVPGGFDHWEVTEITAAAEEGGAQNAAAVGRGFSPGATTPAAIVYTSGTTGTAKGAVLTQGNFAANATTLVDAWRITSVDRFLLPLPLFHVHGLGNGLCCWLASGCRMRLLVRFDAATAAAEFESFAPTLFFGVPTIYVRLLVLPAGVAASIGERMRLFVSGSAPLAAQVFAEFQAKFGHAILERYGMTETFMNIGNPYDGERRPGTVGKPLPGVEVRIVPPEGGTPDTGEVQVRGANVFAGYWRRPDATAAAFVDGWFRTGDVGQRSADGYITLCGRMGDLIISGGFNIYPREIEETLLAHPGIREAAVVGAPDAARGEVPIAYLVADDTVEDEAVREHLKRELASFKMPRAFVRMDALPRTALGKVQRHMLPKWNGAS